MPLQPSPAISDDAAQDRRRFGPAAVGVLLVALTFHVAVAQVGLWDYLAVPDARTSFLDLSFLLAALEGTRAGMDVAAEMPAGEWHPVFNYPRYWLLLSAVPIGLQHAEILGYALMFLTILAMTDVLRPRGKLEIAASLALLMSPAVVFATERGNMDLVIFIVIWAAWRVLRKDPTPGSLGMAAGFVSLATLLKLYPVVGLPIVLRHARRRRVVIGLAALSAGTLLLGGLEWLHIREGLPTAPGRYAFGARLLFDYLGIALPAITAVAAAGVGLLAAVVYVPLRHWDLPTVSRSSREAFLLGCGILSLCFVMGTGFDYRLIFMALVLPLLFEIASAQSVAARSRHGAVVLLGLLAFIAWAEVADLYTRVAIRKLGGSQELALRIQPLVHATEHAVTWLAMAVLIVIGARLLAEELRTWRPI